MVINYLTCVLATSPKLSTVVVDLQYSGTLSAIQKKIVVQLRVCASNSLFVRSQLLGITNLVNRAATWLWLAVDYSPGPYCTPRKLDLAHSV